MKAVSLYADWDPRDGFELGPKDVDGKLTYSGSKVWRNPKLKIEEKPKPELKSGQVLLEVKACGVCGTDVHIAQSDEDGYIYYPGLVAFPCTLGHEISGKVVDAAPDAFDKATNKPFRKGELVCVEEMIWCGKCQPCADGYPNHCERLEEIGISVDGGFAKYLAVDAKLCWNIDSLVEVYGADKAALLGSLVEPTCVAYNAVIERGGGIRPGDNVLVLGSGPIGLAACAILKRAGASKVIISEPSPERAKMAQDLGATDVINPIKANVSQEVLKITNGYGVNLCLEATGLADVIWRDIEDIIWNGRTLNTTVVIVARADTRIPLNGEVFQVRRAGIVGAQGHSGHGTFPRVISAMASGMDMTPVITKKISLDEVPENIVMLQTDRSECKVTVVM